MDDKSESLVCRRCSRDGDGVKCSGLPNGGRLPCALLLGFAPFVPPAVQRSAAQAVGCHSFTGLVWI